MVEANREVLDNTNSSEVVDKAGSAGSVSSSVNVIVFACRH